MRYLAGWSQEDLAKILGISRAYVNGVEECRIKLKEMMFYALCAIFIHRSFELEDDEGLIMNDYIYLIFNNDFESLYEYNKIINSVIDHYNGKLGVVSATERIYEALKFNQDLL
jgi:transcriptional regulator with XRE-family HTH domain